MAAETSPTGSRDAAADIVAALEAHVLDADGRIRVEDLLSAASAVCGEACLAAAGEVDVEHHAFTPGSAVLSDRVNGILANDSVDPAADGSSVFGLIRAGALAHGYAAADVPPLDDVFRGFAAGIAGASGAEATPWGFVPLTVPPDNRPRTMPLRDAYELRGPVRAILGRHGTPVREWPLVTALAVVMELARVAAAIDHAVALRLVHETINGMAKTAPMTDEALHRR